MRIGIDLDDTLVKTTDIIEKIIAREKYDIVTSDFRKWTEEDKHDFFGRHNEEAVSEAELFEDAKEVIDELKSMGHELWIITARNNLYNPKTVECTMNFLKKHNLEFEKITLSTSYKAQYCLENDVDLLIDDKPQNCEKTIAIGKKAILFDSKYNKECNVKRAYNWYEVLEMIKEMEG